MFSNLASHYYLMRKMNKLLLSLFLLLSSSFLLAINADEPKSTNVLKGIYNELKVDVIKATGFILDKLEKKKYHVVGEGYEIWCLGNCDLSEDVTTVTTPG